MTDQTEKRAARYLLAREEPGWSAEDEADFQAWLAASDRHRAHFWRLEYGWRAADRIAAIGATSSAPRRWWLADWHTGRVKMAVAASLLAIFGISILMYRADPPAYRSYVSHDRPMNLSFPDGVRIELNAKSRVRVAMTGHRRLVILDRGEAYFDVVHDAKRSLQVRVGDYQVTDIGTKFLVRTDHRGITTAVVEGEVQLGLAERDIDNPLLLKRGDWAVTNKGATYAHSSDLEGVETMLGWRSGLIIFKRAPLAEVAQDFNRYNDRKLVITDPDTAAIKIDGSFKIGNVDGFCRLMRDAYGLRVAESPHEIKISKK